MKTRWPILPLLLGLACETAPPAENTPPPPATPAFSMTTQEKTYEGCIAGTKDCTYVRLDYPALRDVPKGAEAVAESATQAIHDFVLRPLEEPAEDEPPRKLVDAFIEDYRAFREAQPRADQAWHLERKAFVLRNTESVLSLSLCERSFTGGDHGSETFHFESFDGRTGARLSLDDVLVPGKRPELEALAEARFRERHELAPDADLAEAGFTFEEGRFALTENFAVTDDGLVFHYNPDEIAPYAFGPTDIELSWSELDAVVAPRFAPPSPSGT